MVKKREIDSPGIGLGTHPRLRAALAPVGGALITLSLAPFSIWPAGIAACFIFLYCLLECNSRQALWRGWLFGLGLFGSGASWIYVSIHVHGNAGVPLAALLTAMFCAGLALLYALLAWCYVKWVRHLPGGMLLGFPTLWVLFEWLRSWMLTGFPWLLLGSAHLDTPLAGWAPILGVFGLSLWVALSASCLFLAWRRKALNSLAAYGVVIATIWIGGAQLRSIEWVAPASPESLSVAMVQANIPQELKWTRGFYQPTLDLYRDMTMELLGTDIIVWPESAIPNYYQRADDFLEPIAALAEAAESTLILGIPWREQGQSNYYNAIVSTGQGSGHYFKQHLVPFGEYVPLEAWLRGLIAFFDLPMSAFSKGPAEQPPLRAKSFRVAPFICYEVVYPDLVSRSARDADLLITISNDSWFGASIGPLQHLEMARMRALENGRYLIRSTNNGISAIVNHRGEIVTQSEQFVATVLRGEARVMLGSTPFGSFGSSPVLVACVMALLGMLALFRTFWREE